MVASGLFGALGFDKLAVETGDIAQRYILRTFGCACTGVGTVTETKFVHLFNHGTGAASTFNLTLGKKGKLAYLSTDEEHG